MSSRNTVQFTTRLDNDWAKFIRLSVRPYLLERGFIAKDSDFAVTQYALWFLAKTVDKDLVAQQTVVEENAHDGFEGRLLAVEQDIGVLREAFQSIDTRLDGLNSLEINVNTLVKRLEQVSQLGEKVRGANVNGQSQIGSNAQNNGSTKEESATGKPPKTPSKKRGRKGRK